jgi:hypothetical protein
MSKIMKKTFGLGISLLLVLTLLLGSFTTTQAAAGDDPVVTPISGDLEFITEIVPIAHLPGTTALASQMLVPVGFPAGEAQFGGNGIRVAGMDSGKATACFSLNTLSVKQGWGGKVGVWNGSKWVLLPTTISTTSDEAAATTACATISGNGTYAFIQYVVAPEKLPKVNPLQPCNGEVDSLYWGQSGNTFISFGIGLLTAAPGIPVSYIILPVAGTYDGTLTGTTLTDAHGVAHFTGPVIVTSLGYYEFYFRFFLPTCYVDWDPSGTIVE